MVEAGITDLADTPDPEAWARAANRWEDCQDVYWTAGVDSRFAAADLAHRVGWAAPKRRGV